jgi:hypothetical protein
MVEKSLRRNDGEKMEKLPVPANREDAYSIYEQIRQETRDARDREQALRARIKAMGNESVISSSDMGNNLSKIIPPHLTPKNVGDLAGVMWDFYFTTTFDFGTDPTFDLNSKMIDNFRVDQEASFLLMGFSRSYHSNGNAGRLAPIGLTLRDAQSTRQFNDQPFPIQNIGEHGQPTRLETPLLFSANATVIVEATSWVPEAMDTIGNGKHEITFFGLRVRDTDNVKVISQMFL